MNDAAKWAYLERAPRRDATHPSIRRLATMLMHAAQLSHPPSLPVQRMRFVQLAFTVARDWIRYEIDSDRVGREDIAGFTRQPKPDDPVDALFRGVDDCDAKSRLFAALCLAQGVQARIVPHWEHGGLAHVSAAFSTDGATWIPVELTLSRARIGDTAKDIPKETETGKWQTT
jgi:transglutaminase-like putative cysteine protease